MKQKIQLSEYIKANAESRYENLDLLSIFVMIHIEVSQTLKITNVISPEARLTIIRTHFMYIGFT